jgi:hypothetical protein
LHARDHAPATPTGAPHAQVPPAAVHRQLLPHWHDALLACGLAAVAAWQPHVQPAPGQAAQRQGLVSREFMAFPLLRCRTRRVRGNAFCGRDASTN